jgi:hypothetical protein
LDGEEIMSQSNDSSKLGRATLEDHRPLADSELDAVTGGWLPTGIPGANMPVLYVGETIAGRRIQK